METRLLAVGDLHLRKTRPAMRTDDYFQTQEAKLAYIFQTAIENDCGHIVFPGDVFDRADAPYSLTEWAIRQFKNMSADFYFVFGNHDLRYHTLDKANCPLGVLCAALGPRGHVLTPDNPVNVDGVAMLYGCSWGEELPRKLEKSEGKLKVMVMHRFITNVPVDFPEDALLARDLVKQCNANLFITGDNHQQFIYNSPAGNVPVINLGSVMRQTSAQMAHHPMVSIIEVYEDGSGFGMENLVIPVEADVFDMEAIEDKEVSDEKIAKFVSGLQGSFDPELKFVDNLRLAIKDAPEAVQDVIREALDG